MPTTITKTIKKTGGDFGTIAAWLTATELDLITNGGNPDFDTIQVGLVDPDVWDENFVVMGATTDATRYRVLRGVVGTVGPGVGARIEYSGSGHVIENQESFFHLDWMYVTRTVAGAASDELFRLTENTVIQNSWIEHQLDTTDQDCIYSGATGKSHLIENCFVIRAVRGGIMQQITSDSDWTIYNTAVARTANAAEDSNAPAVRVFSSAGMDYTGSVWTLRNVVAMKTNFSAGNKKAFNIESSSGNGSFDGSSGFCASSDDSAEEVNGTNFRNDVLYDTSNFVNVTQGSDDLHIVALGDLDENGEDLTGIIDKATDIDNNNYTVPWPIGADIIAASGAVNNHAGSSTSSGAFRLEIVKAFVGASNSSGVFNPVAADTEISHAGQSTYSGRNVVTLEKLSNLGSSTFSGVFTINVQDRIHSFAGQSTSSGVYKKGNIMASFSGQSGSSGVYAKAIVKSFDANVGSSKHTGDFNFVTLQVPAAPTTVVATTVSHVRVNVTYAYTGPDLDNFQVEFRPNAAGPWLPGSSSNDGTARSISQGGLTPETLYEFRVLAINALATTISSNTDTATTNATPPFVEDDLFILVAAEVL